MSGDDTAIRMISDTLDQIREGVTEVTTSSAAMAATLDAVDARVKQTEKAINGEGAGRPGLETRVTVLETAERERAKAARVRAAQPAAPVESEIAKVEMAREAAASKRWEAVKSWAPLAAVGGAAVAKFAEWALAALGGK